MSDFVVGLQITGLGMGLVFLTLLIVMLAITLLNRFFEGQATEQEAGTPRPAVAAAPRAQEVRANTREEAAAIALVIALERSKAGTDDDRERDGEIVTVMAIDPGPGIWNGHGRLKAMQ